MDVKERPAVAEEGLLEQARAGDEFAFARLVEPHRAGLLAHCYRMLGSLHDAEDALQDALLRAWRGIARMEGRSALRTWLHRIATNTCLDAIARRPRRVLPVDYGPEVSAREHESARPLSRSIWIEPISDSELGIEDGREGPEARYERRESIELAFIAALQHLPPRQRAVLILRDVLSFSARETAACLDITVASANGLLHRARATAEERLPEHSQQSTLRELGDDGVARLVRNFTDAFERGDVPAILELLTDDATFAMPPYPGWRRGREAVGDSWLMPGGPPPRLRYARTDVNGQPAVGTYLIDAGSDSYLPLALDVLTIRGARISDVTVFRTPELFGRWGLPERL
jgi:RNA polymerase sigma-70 factor, ECF subfamily